MSASRYFGISEGDHGVLCATYWPAGQKVAFGTTPKAAALELLQMALKLAGEHMSPEEIRAVVTVSEIEKGA